MIRVFVRCAKHSAALSSVMLLALAPPALAAGGIDFTYLEAGYAVDSTIQAFGQSYDSDDSYRIDGSYQFNRHVFATAQYYSAGYDFEGQLRLRLLRLFARRGLHGAHQQHGRDAGRVVRRVELRAQQDAQPAP
jgi:hypothetical protein